MIELIIGALIVFVLVICFYALAACGNSEVCCSKAELVEMLSSLPDNAVIYITIEKNGTDFYGTDNH